MICAGATPKCRKSLKCTNAPDRHEGFSGRFSLILNCLNGPQILARKGKKIPPANRAKGREK
jgi:hypothetical protein